MPGEGERWGNDVFFEVGGEGRGHSGQGQSQGIRVNRGEDMAYGKSRKRSRVKGRVTERAWLPACKQGSMDTRHGYRLYPGTGGSSTWCEPKLTGL